VERTLLIGVGALAWFMYFPIAQLLDLKGSFAFQTQLDSLIPFWPPAEWVYVAAYPLCLLPAFLIRDLGILRRYAAAFAGMQLIAFLLFVLLPIRVERLQTIDPSHSITDWAIALIYALDPTPMKCFPSLHVANSFLVALVSYRLDRLVGRWTTALAFGIALSTLMVKQHYIADVLGGLLLAVAAFLVAFGWEADVHTGPGKTFPRWYLAGVPLLYGAMVVSAWCFRALSG
jgi:membrane-associated phospholipid phosphatase